MARTCRCGAPVATKLFGEPCDFGCCAACFPQMVPDFDWDQARREYHQRQIQIWVGEERRSGRDRRKA